MTDQSQALRRMPQPFYMDFDVSTIKHLGLQMYSTLPPVVGELIANAWDANATSVQITIPETQSTNSRRRSSSSTPHGSDRSDRTLSDRGFSCAGTQIFSRW